MHYSYGSRRFALGRIPTEAIYIFFSVGLLARDDVHSANHAFWSAISRGSLLIAAILLAVSLVPYLWPKKRPDLPTGLEITDSGTLRFFHGQEMYAEIPIDQIASLQYVMLQVLPWTIVEVSELKLKSRTQGIDHIYVLPYLIGFSEFITKLRDRAPQLRPAHSGPEWTSIRSKGPWNTLVALGLLSLMFLIYFAANLAHPRGSALHYATNLVIFGGISAALIAATWFAAKRARNNPTIITIYPGKMQIVGSSVAYTDILREDITGVELIPAGKDAEQCVIHAKNRDFPISAANMYDYPGLVERIKEFVGASKVTTAKEN